MHHADYKSSQINKFIHVNGQVLNGNLDIHLTCNIYHTTMCDVIELPYWVAKSCEAHTPCFLFHS